MLVLVLTGAKDEGSKARVLEFWCRVGPEKPVPFKLADEVTEAGLVGTLTMLLLALVTGDTDVVLVLLLRIIGVMVVDIVEYERLLGAMKEVVLARVGEAVVEVPFGMISEDTVDEVLTVPEGEIRLGCVETRAAALLPLELVNIEDEV